MISEKSINIFWFQAIQTYYFMCNKHLETKFFNTDSNNAYKVIRNQQPIKPFHCVIVYKGTFMCDQDKQ